MSFCLHVHGDEQPRRQAPSRPVACLQFVVVFIGAFIIFDAAVTRGQITKLVTAEVFHKAESAKVTLASAVVR
jgi:hypothetical protein